MYYISKKFTFTEFMFQFTSFNPTMTPVFQSKRIRLQCRICTNVPQNLLKHFCVCSKTSKGNIIPSFVHIWSHVQSIQTSINQDRTVGYYILTSLHIIPLRMVLIFESINETLLHPFQCEDVKVPKVRFFRTVWSTTDFELIVYILTRYPSTHGPVRPKHVSVGVCPTTPTVP